MATTKVKRINLRSMLHEREGFAAVPLSEVELLIAGGQGSDRFELNSAELYNISTQHRQELPPMNHCRYGCAAVIIDKKVYVLGRFNSHTGELNSVEVLNATSKETMAEGWTEIAAKMKNKRACCTAVAIGKEIYIAGGYHQGRAIQEVEAYNVYQKQEGSRMSLR